MDCKRSRIEIEEEVGQGASVGAAAEAHVAACGGCRTFRAERATVRGLVAGLARVDAPNDFEFRLRARLAAEGGVSAGRARRPFLPRAAWAAVAGCLILAAAVSMRLRQTTPADGGSQVPPAAQTAAVDTGPLSNRPAVAAATGATPTDAAVEGTHAGIETKTVVDSKPLVRRSGRQTVVPRAVVEEIARGVGKPGGLEEHSRSVIGGTVIPLQVSAEEQPLQVTFKDMQGASRVVKVDPVAFGSREPAVSGARVVNATHKQGVW